jgi:hypothetical protein
VEYLGRKHLTLFLDNTQQKQNEVTRDGWFLIIFPTYIPCWHLQTVTHACACLRGLLCYAFRTVLQLFHRLGLVHAVRCIPGAVCLDSLFALSRKFGLPVAPSSLLLGDAIVFVPLIVRKNIFSGKELDIKF